MNLVILGTYPYFLPSPKVSITSLLKVTDDWLKSIDDGPNTGAVFIDLNKVFDTRC